MDKKKLVAGGGFILAILMFLVNQGWVDINIDPQPQPPVPVVIPDEPEPPIDPVPDITPDNPTPTPVNPSNEILIEIAAEGFPSVPTSLSNESLPIKESLLRCADANKALLVARVYADWDSAIQLDLVKEELTNWQQFREKHTKSIKGILAKHGLKNLCIGFGPLVDQVIIEATGEHSAEEKVSSDDFNNISLAFQAVSARAYEAFQELVK